MHFALLLTVATSLLVGVTAPRPQARQPQTGGSAIPALRPAGQQRPNQQTGGRFQAAPAQQLPGQGFQQSPGQAGQGFQQSPGQAGQGFQAAPAQQLTGQGFQQSSGQAGQGFRAAPAQQLPGQGFQQSPFQQPGQGFQGSPVQQFPQDSTVVEVTTVTVSSFDTVTHYLQVTQTSNIIVTESTGTNLFLTQEVTVRQAQPGRPNTVTAVVTANQAPLVVETVRTGVNTGKVATATATVFATTTQNSPCTKIITHYDRVLEQTVVPVQTVVYVDQISTETVTATITQEVTTTLYNSPGTNSKAY